MIYVLIQIYTMNVLSHKKNEIQRIFSNMGGPRVSSYSGSGLCLTSKPSVGAFPYTNDFQRHLANAWFFQKKSRTTEVWNVLINPMKNVGYSDWYYGRCSWNAEDSKVGVQRDSKVLQARSKRTLKLL